ncbi:hypothetical protein SAMN05428966_10283 [Massilia sp. PDC64]|nr:hypothetical protein [Massilia sp. PDC64]SDC67224.1 hypothetical protein SAMN05428966_10283 [Massilia sp. PDC64]
MGAPVGITCPDIDSVIIDIDQCVNTLSSITNSRGLLEKLRDANANLRAWGEEMEERAEAAEEALAAMTERAEAAEQRLSQLETA